MTPCASTGRATDPSDLARRPPRLHQPARVKMVRSSWAAPDSTMVEVTVPPAAGMLEVIEQLDSGAYL